MHAVFNYVMIANVDPSLQISIILDNYLLQKIEKVGTGKAFHVRFEVRIKYTYANVQRFINVRT